MENEKVAVKEATQEVILKAKKGMPILILNLLGILASIVLFVWGIISLEDYFT